MNAMYTILLHLIIFHTAILQDPMTIVGDFKHCFIDDTINHIDLDSVCQDEFNKIELCDNCAQRDKMLRENGAMIFTRHHYIIEGYGYECSIREYLHRKSKDFVGLVHTATGTRWGHITKHDCWKMVESDLCGTNKMNCTNKEQCSYTEPIPDLSEPGWESKTTAYTTDCTYRKTLILGKEYGGKLFKDAKSECTAQNLECLLDTSIIVWKNDIVRNCHFEPALLIDDLTPVSSVSGYTNKNVYQSRLNRFIFKLTDNYETACDGIKFLQTHQGLYFVELTTPIIKQKVLSLPKSKVGITHLQDNDIRDFMLAEEDYDKQMMLYTMAKVACYSLINTIRAHLDSQDKFLNIQEFGSTDVILYIKDGLAYIPFCNNVSQITVIQNTTACYKDFPVTYTMNSKPFNGFLRQHNILTQYSKLHDCKTNDKNLVIENSFKIIKRKNQIVTVNKYNHNLSTKLKIPFFDETSLNNAFKHHELIVNSTGMLENMEELIISKEHNIDFYVKKNENFEIDRVEKEPSWPVRLANNFINYYSGIKQNIFNIFMAIVHICIIIIVFYVSVKLAVYTYCKCKTVKLRRQKTIAQESHELMDIPV